MTTVEEQQAAALRRAELEALEPIDFVTLKETFDEWMILPDKYLIKYVIACYCANKLSQRPVWAIIVAPSGGGKTEILNALLCLPDIYSLSTVTPNTFLSGMPGGKDASLLPKITDKLLLFKDWTTILAMQKDARAEIFGQFRDIYDGAMTKVYGNGQERKWVGKVSILAASTEAVDMSQQQYTHLGERFVFYRPVMPDRKAVAFRSLENAAHQNDMTKSLQNAVFAFIKGIDFSKYATLPELPVKVQHELVLLAEFITKARSGVIRDFGFKKEVLFVPTPEMPTRVLQQVSLIGQGAMIANGGEITDDDIAMLYKTMIDSVPRTNWMVIREMAKGDGQTTAAIATALGYPTDTIRTYLENQSLLGVCKREKADVGKGDTWHIDPGYAAIVQRYEEIKKLSETELKDREEATKTADELAADEDWEAIGAVESDASTS